MKYTLDLEKQDQLDLATLYIMARDKYKSEAIVKNINELIKELLFKIYKNNFSKFHTHNSDKLHKLSDVISEKENSLDADLVFKYEGEEYSANDLLNMPINFAGKADGVTPPSLSGIINELMDVSSDANNHAPLQKFKIDFIRARINKVLKRTLYSDDE